MWAYFCISMWKPEIKIWHLPLFHPTLFFDLVLFISVLVCVCFLYCICGGMHAVMCVWKSGAESVKLLLSFHPHVASRDWTRVIGLALLASECLCPLSHLANPPYFWDRLFHWTWNSSIHLGWPVNFWAQPVSCKHMMLCQTFYIGAGCLKVGSSCLSTKHFTY